MSCGGPPDGQKPKDEVPFEAEWQPLSDADRLIRASMVLRKMRPSIEDLERVRADPEAYGDIIDGYLESDEYALVIRDMWAQILLLRTDTFNQLPVLGDLRGHGYTLQDVFVSQTEEPLRLVEHIVMNDKPFTEIVTADYMLTDALNARMYGLPYDFEDPESWQMSYWSDERPKAGLLSSAEVWRRFESDGSNFHRGRANMVARDLLCEDFDTRDILVAGGIDIADEFEVANAIQTVDACVGCHQALDPLAAYFWGYMQLVHRNAVRDAILGDCAPFDYADGNDPPYGPNHLPEYFCYPIKQYSAFMEDEWEFWQLRPPSYYGKPAKDLRDVGQLIAEDPRFSQCMSRQFYGYLNQLAAVDVPYEIAIDLQSTFEESGFNAKALTKAIVMEDAFGSFATNEPQIAPTVSIKAIRPGEYANTLEDLTGYRWWALADKGDCATRSINGTECWGDIDLSTTDLFGFRSMQGGIDALNITQPTFTVTPTKMLSAQMLASDAAHWVVENDFAATADDRRLLKLVEADTSDEAAVRAQLAWLTLRILGQWVEPDSPEIDQRYDLWMTGLDLRGDPAGAWTLTLIAYLQDPRMLFY
jgi:hypothetical protein